MPTPAYCVYYRNGKIEVPEELRKELQLKEDDRVSAVHSGDPIILNRLSSPELER